MPNKSEASGTRRYPSLYKIWPGLYNWAYRKTEDWNFICGVLSGGKESYQDSRTIYETYIKGEYAQLYKAIKPNTTLIDIGANIGDTAIYFAMNPNVKRVLAFEPIPNNYKRAAENIRKSPFSDKITLFNIGIAEKTGSIKISRETDGTPATRLSEIDGRGNTKIKLRNLNEVLKGKRKIAIKCDCEGSEADIFNNANLGEVYAIQLEYHYCYPKVRDALRKNGFIMPASQPDGPQGLVFTKK